MTPSTLTAGRIPAAERGMLALAAAVTVTWLAAVVALGSRGVFNAAPDAPPVATLAAIMLPPALFLGLLRVARIRQAVLRIDPVWLAAVHGLRILGAGFLFVYAFGHLPELFAHTAGWGDVLVAALAPFVAARLAADPRFLRSSWHLGFHVLGLADFAGAVLSGLIARGTLPLLGLSESTAALGALPLALIPCFAVPLWICLHIAAILRIREARRAGDGGRARSPPGDAPSSA